MNSCHEYPCSVTFFLAFFCTRVVRVLFLAKAMRVLQLDPYLAGAIHLNPIGIRFCDVYNTGTGLLADQFFLVAVLLQVKAFVERHGFSLPLAGCIPLFNPFACSLTNDRDALPLQKSVHWPTCGFCRGEPSREE